MASEYLKWKYRDVKPDEPPPPLTGWPKVKNWLRYNIGWVIAGVVIAGIVGSMIWNILGVGKTSPDYILAYVGKGPLPDDAEKALTTQLAALGEDVNGDGEVTVELRTYVTGSTSESMISYGAATMVTLAADIENGESTFFLTDDPLSLQLGYHILANLDGSLPDEEDYEVEGRVLAWSDCPVLSSLELGEYTADTLGEEAVTGQVQDLMKGLYLGRRGFYDPDKEKNHEANEEFWQRITQGAGKS